MQDNGPFRDFLFRFNRLVSRSSGNEREMLQGGDSLLSELVAKDNWLPERFAQPGLRKYRQYLLHCDPMRRYSVVSFVWGPAQQTPVHDHTVWGLIGMLRGAEQSERYAPGMPMRRLNETVLLPGMVERLSPAEGDIHRVSNLHQDRVSVSIHVYGGDIGMIRRHVFDPETGSSDEFVSGYANVFTPFPSCGRHDSV
jgi:predicted metal-dependent enzyme (double-stranded beta helix superfamily)